MDTVDLGLLGTEPTLQGSVQRMYSAHEHGSEYLLCEAVDDGSVFDVGALFVIQGSGRARNTLRHQVFAAISDPARWQDLRINDRRFDDKQYVDNLLSGGAIEEFRLRGVPTHHMGSVDAVTGRIDTAPSAKPSHLVLIRRLPVVRPLLTYLHRDRVYDYSDYIEARSKVMALEQIVRLGLPGGSAVLNRSRDLSSTDNAVAAETYLSRYGATLPLRSWSNLPRPICDWQCKYEDYDRNLDPQEALYIGGVSARKLNTIGVWLMLCSMMADSILSNGGLTLWDLKWEVGIERDEPIIVDTMDHDSMRITYAIRHNGMTCHVHFNKQAIRDYYNIFHPDWLAAIKMAKRAAETDALNRPFMELYGKGVEDKVYPAIPALDPEYAQLQAFKYQFVTDIARNESDAAVGRDLARQELAYYESRGRLDQLMEHIVQSQVP